MLSKPPLRPGGQNGSTIKVLHTLRPIVMAMAGAGEYDPWKD
jgi:tRNA-splicing ligase RtcB